MGWIIKMETFIIPRIEDIKVYDPKTDGLDFSTYQQVHSTYQQVYKAAKAINRLAADIIMEGQDIIMQDIIMKGLISKVSDSIVWQC